MTAIVSTEPQGVRSIVVGGGRALGFPPLRQGDVALNVARHSEPHVVGDIANAPFRAGRFSHAYFERVPFTAFTRRNAHSLDEAARILRPGGTITIETGSAAPIDEIVERMGTLGFVRIRAERISHMHGFFLRIRAVRQRSS